MEKNQKKGIYYHYKLSITLKLIRLVDLIIILFALPLALFLSIYVIFFYIYKKEKWPYIYQGSRLGRDDNIFFQYKFRTLQVNSTQLTDLKGNIVVLDNDPRLNKVGRFLRSTHLDELPQLINILKGEMSFVGPRPIPPGTSYNVQYKRHSIPPGLVGLQVINGRNLNWRNKQKFDFFYYKRINVKLYFYILFLALYKIIINLIQRKNNYEHRN
jgi:lipopolysaccharide/colanic/teichoic acid biosynthesis glycosyltransferase